MTDWKAVFGPDYPKIDTIFERDGRGVIMPDRKVSPVIAYLWDLPWEWDEKIDGTNIRLHWDGSRVHVCGRETNAQINARLLAALTRQDLLSPALWESAFPEANDVTVYGEGFGGDIQDAGKLYGEEPSLIVFDVNIGGWWLSRENMKDVAGKLGLPVVPLLFITTIADAWEMTVAGSYSSAWPGVSIEGLVGRPAVDLYTRKGERVMAKMKVRDHRDWLRAQESPTGRKGKRRPDEQSFNPALERAAQGSLIGGPGEQGVRHKNWGAQDVRKTATGFEISDAAAQEVLAVSGLSDGAAQGGSSPLDAEVTRGLAEVTLIPDNPEPGA